MAARVGSSVDWRSGKKEGDETRQLPMGLARFHGGCLCYIWGVQRKAARSFLLSECLLGGLQGNSRLRHLHE